MFLDVESQAGMNRRDAIYLGFLAWLFAFGIADPFILSFFGPEGLTVSDIVNIVAYITFVMTWCLADARLNGFDPPNRSTRFAMVLLLPVGLGLYLFKTREAGAATLTLLAFLAGVAMVAIGGLLLGERLVLAYGYP